MRNGVIDVVD